MNKASVFETTGQDWANHLSHEVSGNGMIYFVALLSESPDAEKLRKATADLISLQPVLGCRFDDTSEPPVWKPVSDDGWFVEAEADDLRQGISRIVRRTPSQGRQISVVLLTMPGQSAICLCLDHAAIDGGGAKRCLALLSRCYLQYCGGQRVVDEFCDNRSDGQVYARCGLPDYRAALRREAPSAAPIATVPYAGMDGRTVCYSWTSLPLSDVRRDGSTVNDCLLAAYIQALSEVCPDKSTVEIHMTVDLRRYLDEEAAPLAGNLSGMATISLEVGQQTSYTLMLLEVQRQTALLKSGHMGLSSAAMMTYLRTMPYSMAKGALLEAGRKSRASGIAAHILTNLGRLAADTIMFGNARVTDVIPLLPAMRAPAFMLGACGWGDKLTLSAGYYAEERAAEDIEKLLNSIREILAG